jgi:hypothetical protein
MSIKFFLVVVVGLIGYTNGILNDQRCKPKEKLSEDVQGSISTLCREAKIENDASNNADFIFTYKNPSSGGIGFSYGGGGYTAAASVSYLNIIIKEKFLFSG